MASTTPNIGLTLPTGTEGWKRSVINGNFMILDTKIGAVGNTPLQTQINTLSSQLTSVSSTGFTAGTDVTIDMQRSMFVGKLAVYNLVVTTSAAKSRNDTIVSGLKAHDGGFNGVPTVLATDNNGNFAQFMVSDSGTLIAAANVPTGKWRMSFSFIST